MITIHVDSTVLKPSFYDSCQDTKEFDFDGKDDSSVQQAITDYFFELKAKGHINISLQSEDSQVSEDCPELRFGKTYMLGNGGYSTKYVEDMTFDQLQGYWASHGH